MFNDNNSIISNCPICERKSLHVINSLVDGDKASSQQCINCGYATTENFELHGKPKEENPSYKALTTQMKEWSKLANDTVWIPTIMTLPDGMIYPFDEDGKMKWGLAPMVTISEEEQKNYPIPGQEGQFYKQKYDTDIATTFDKFIDFISKIIKLPAKPVIQTKFLITETVVAISSLFLLAT